MRRRMFLLFLVLAVVLSGCKKNKPGKEEESSSTEVETTTAKEEEKEEAIQKRNPGALLSWEGKAVTGSLEVLDLADFNWLKLEKTEGEDEARFALNGSFGEEDASFGLEVLLVSKMPELIFDIDEEADYDITDLVADALTARDQQAAVLQETFGGLSWDWGTAASEESGNAGWSLYGYSAPGASEERSIFVSINVIPAGTETVVPTDVRKELEDWFKGLQLTADGSTPAGGNRVFWLKNGDAVLSASDADLLALSNLALEYSQFGEDASELRIRGIYGEGEEAIQMDAEILLKKAEKGEQKEPDWKATIDVTEGVYTLTAEGSDAGYVLTASALKEEAGEADYKDFGASAENWLGSCRIQ